MKKFALLILLAGGTVAAAFGQTSSQNVLALGTHVLKQGVDTAVDVYLLNPQKVAGLQARIIYDASLFEVVSTGTETTGSVISGFGAVNPEDGVAADSNGFKGISFAIAGSAGATKSGKVITLTFHPKTGDTVGASSAFKLDADPTQFVMSDESSNPVTTNHTDGALIVGGSSTATFAGWSRSDFISQGVSGSVTTDGLATLWLVTNDGALHAVNAADGTDLAGFTAPSLGGAVAGRPVYKEGAVYAATLAGKVYRIDPKTGVVSDGWPVDLSGGSATFEIVSTPAVANGSVYVTDNADTIHILDSTTGAAGATAVISTGGAAGTQGYSSPSIPAGIGSVWVGGADNGIHQYSGTDLTPLKSVIPTGGAVQSSPFIDTAGEGFIGSQDGKIYGFDAGTGNSLGSYDTGAPVLNSLFPSSTGFIGVNNAGSLVQVTISGTAVQGSNPSAAKFSGGSGLTQSPIVLSDTVWVGDANGLIHSAKVDGTGIKNITAGTPVSSPAVIAASGEIVFASSDGSVFAILAQ